MTDPRDIPEEARAGAIPGPDPGACSICGAWRKAGMIHRCEPVTDVLSAERDALLARAAAAEARADKLAEALRRHGRHHSGCEAGASLFPGPCTCGLRAALADATTEEDQ